MKRRSQYPLIRLPEKMDIILALIKEELKSTCFFNSLQKAGIDDVSYQVHLGSPILRLMGVRDCKDEIFTAYLNIIDKASKNIIDKDHDRLIKYSLKVYYKLKREIRYHAKQG